MKVRLIPDTVVARTLLVLIVGLTVSHVLSVALYFTDQTTAIMFVRGQHLADRILRIERLTEAASDAERNRIVSLADDSEFHISWNRNRATDDAPAEGWKEDFRRGVLSAHLDDRRARIVHLRFAETMTTNTWREHIDEAHNGRDIGEAFLVSLQLPDMSWLNFAAPVEAPHAFWTPRFVVSMAIMLLAVGVLSILVVLHLTRPMSVFARAAQRLGVYVNAPPLPETGPAEVRRAANAFNEMQGRIRRFVEDRTEMVAAISHDLGTPITRLRLRTEFVEDEEQRAKMLADLDDMEKMVVSALSFARDEATSGRVAMVDLRSLLQRVCDDMTDMGHRVSLEAEDKAVAYQCRPVALRRALANLIDNAVKYGGRAQVSLESTAEAVRIRIDDDGPGIPSEFREDVFKPFRRLEASRNRETGGSGLGLTVARTIIRGHGGDLSLINRSAGGLRVDMRLPHTDDPGREG